MNSFKKKDSGWLKIMSDNVNNIYNLHTYLYLFFQFVFYGSILSFTFLTMLVYVILHEYLHLTVGTSTFSRLGLYKIPRFFNILIKYYYGRKILSNFQIYFLWAPGKYWCMQCAIFYERFWFHCFGKFNKRWIHFKKYR